MPQIGNAEIGRRLERIEKKLDETTNIYVSREGHQYLVERVKNLENAQTWAFRLMAGAFLGLIIEAIVLILRAQ